MKTFVLDLGANNSETAENLFGKKTITKPEIFFSCQKHDFVTSVQLRLTVTHHQTWDCSETTAVAV